jgi:hypothetical protein
LRAQTRYPRKGTQLKSHGVAGAENRSERSEQEALVDGNPIGAKKIAVLLDEFASQADLHAW